MKPIYLAAMGYQSPQAGETGKSVNRFGMKLLADVAAQRRQKNVFVSPLSVFTALALADTGAAGRTREAIRHAMAIPSEVGEDA